MLRIVFLIGAIACSTGCTTGYWTDRGRDAADIFTFALCPIIGAKGRVGPISTGVALHDNISVGLSSGRFGKTMNGIGRYGKDFPSFELLVVGYDEYKAKGIPKERDKGYRSDMVLMVNMERSDHRVMIPPFWTQVEVRAGLYYGGKIGFNPGELLDFILGFAGIDIYKDDLERRKAKAEEADLSLPDPAKNRPPPPGGTGR